MRKDKEIAFEMRRSAKSYNDISKYLNVPKSTLSGWFSSIDWSNDIKNTLNEYALEHHVYHLKNLSKDRGDKLRDIYEEAQKEAEEEFMFLKHNPLFVSMIMYYWGTGDKSHKNRCSLSNSDPNMLRLFTLFLEKVCGVEKAKIKAWILAYPDTDHIKAFEFWSKSVGVWPTNFTKTITVKGKNQKLKLPFGVCYIVVSSSYLKRKMVKWMDLLNKELIKNYAGMV